MTKSTKAKQAIYRWHASFGRMGDLDGIFVATEDEIKELEGKVVEFGEVLGKHSDIRYKIEASDFECVSTKENEVEFFLRIRSNLSNGWNPIESYRQQEADRQIEENGK